MRHVSEFSLRVRLISVSVLSMLPLLALIWHDASRQYRRESAALEQEVQRLTAFITGDVEHFLDATRQFLASAAIVDMVSEPAQRPHLFQALTAQSPYYSALGIVADGADASHAVASSADAAAKIDDTLLQRARMSGKIALGETQTSAAQANRTLTVACTLAPTNTATAPVTAFAVLEFDWLEQLLSEGRVTGRHSLFPSNMVLNVLDRSGTILTRYPDNDTYVGKKIPDTDVLAAILSRGEGAAELRGVSGVRRFFAFQTVKGASDGDIFVSVGVSREATLAAARRELYVGIGGVILVGVLLVTTAWIGAGLFVTRPIAALVDATERIGAGDLTARAQLAQGLKELKLLAESFNHMAGGLARHESERQRLLAQLVAYDRQLRSAALETVLAEEQERNQIAAGLHDKVGPLLAACYMKLGLAIKRNPSATVTDPLAECRALIDQAVEGIRSLTFDLSSPTLYTLGLPAAVEELCQDMARHHGLAVTFQDRGTPPGLNNERRVVLYRAARELLLNVVKHAEANQATVVCGGDAEEVFLSVTDDGVGFDAAEAGRGFSRTGGFGLFNLRERLSHLGGRFVVTSGRGSGTQVLVALPTVAQYRDEEANDGDQNPPGG